MKQQPFYVGQRVVCVNDKSDITFTRLKIGKVYIVIGVSKNCCDKWVIDVGIPNDTGTQYCCVCHRLQRRINDLYRASRFAPYDPPAIEIPEELLKEPVEERSDVLTVVAAEPSELLTHQKP